MQQTSLGGGCVNSVTGVPTLGPWIGQFTQIRRRGGPLGGVNAIGCGAKTRPRSGVGSLGEAGSRRGCSQGRLEGWQRERRDGGRGVVRIVIAAINLDKHRGGVDTQFSIVDVNLAGGIAS